MNRFSSAFSFLTLAAGLLLLPGRLHSEWPGQAAQPVQIAPKSPLEALTAAKAANAALLVKQQRTLERLDAMQKEADQLRIWVKRS
ncbi:MAG: hypothetical protein WCP06_07220 [Verrucomicrobiota bacterium]